jgi:c-di-GMP-related signal transduction protein
LAGTPTTAIAGTLRTAIENQISKNYKIAYDDFIFSANKYLLPLKK